MDPTKAIPVLDSAELRVLGSLMEKSRATPDYYPMTVNSLVAACNQKSSRKPVVNFDEETVVLSLETLKKKGLVSTVTGGSSRSVKYKHNFAVLYPVVPAEIAIIALLILRGPQTPGELNTNSGRLYEFDSLQEVQSVLERLTVQPETLFLRQLSRRQGQKEQRFMHLLSRGLEPEEDDSPAEYTTTNHDLEKRLAKVELELTQLKESFEKLMKELLG